MPITPASTASSTDSLDSYPDETGSPVSQGYPLTGRGKFLIAAGVLFLVCGFGLSAYLKPSPRGFGTHQSLGLPPCGFRVWFGTLCPSCGSTTSFAHFVRGEWVAAVKSNVSAFGLALLCAAAIPWGLYSLAIGRLWWVDRPDWTAVWMLAVLCVLSFGQWGVRLVIEAMGAGGT